MQECGNIQTSVSYFRRMNVPQKAAILDVGTRFGTFVHELDQMGYHDSFGIDIDRDAISKGISAYPELEKRLRSFDGKNIPFDAESFDAICMFDVLEHIPNVSEFLRSELWRVLKSRGVLIFQTPNIMTNVPWEIFAHKSLFAWKKYHCSLQTYWSLKRLLFRTGLTQIKIERFLVSSPFNSDLIRKKFGIFSSLVLSALRCSAFVPTPFITNFWGSCRKP
jgi:2-polyprenyl-3-methyl-5-hydroxy-6-metoxy-1,4-benzoquinol methylase